MPYPAHAKNQKFTREYENFLDMFRQLRINLPFIEALQHMPKYAKFLKDLLKRKESLEGLSTVPLNGECSTVVLNKIPEKLPDPGVFTIPCLFGRDTSCQALADIGASIKLIPYSLYEKLGLGELTPTHMEADKRVPIILDRPFLHTARALVDVFEDKREVASSQELMDFDRERDGGKRKFVEFGEIGDMRNKIGEWSYRDAVSWRAMESYQGGGSSTWTAE
ncbi:uncharacterized protein LOC143632873 [Bidens hawaiensis]|uniref:uncharacterized protein LOC143632873 n=1 Tax=Bidens hawaiensis TaxID=980011 RepID=UPI00404A41F6